MMKSMDLTVGDALYLYTICPILPDSSDFLPYKESLFLWLCIEPPRHAWRRPAIQQYRMVTMFMHSGIIGLNYWYRSANFRASPEKEDFAEELDSSIRQISCL
jgi:hypothetical protein